MNWSIYISKLKWKIVHPWLQHKFARSLGIKRQSSRSRSYWPFRMTMVTSHVNASRITDPSWRETNGGRCTRVTLYTAGHLHTAHCWHSRAPIVHTAVPRENNEHGCVYLRCTAVCKLPGCVEGHPWCSWVCVEYLSETHLKLKSRATSFVHNSVWVVQSCCNFA